MTKRHCFVADVGNAIEKLADALDPEREPPFKDDILHLLEWATKDVLAMRQHVKLLRDAGSYLLKDVGEDSSMLGAVDMRLALAATKEQ